VRHLEMENLEMKREKIVLERELSFLVETTLRLENELDEVVKYQHM